MKKFLLATSIVALTAASAFAQSPSANPPAATANPPAAASAGKPAVISPSSLGSSWRSSKLIGLDVYNAQDEKLGDINEILLGTDGKVAAVVIGVGGFLGMGEHDVAVAMDQLKFMEQPRAVKSTSTTTTPATGSSTVGTTTATKTTTSTANDWAPDHAVLNATKDQLRAMTSFKYDASK